MADRIPLWIDLRKAPEREQQSIIEASNAAECEAIFSELPPDVTEIRITKPDDQGRAEAPEGIVVVDAADWTIIPFENLIAARRDRPGTLYALASNPSDALLFRDTLETGVHGIVLQARSAADVAAADNALRQRGTPAAADNAKRPFLETATITAIRDAGMGDRVCVDCTSAFEPGEGLLIGSTARSACLVHAETIQTDYVNARPFRVNAGAIHSYITGPGDRTQYLSEAVAGTSVLAVNDSGTTRELTVGRAKIERRPHLLIAWETSDGWTGNAVLQNAETIRLITDDREPKSITDLRVGDAIVVHCDASARHFGMPVDEYLEEK